MTLPCSALLPVSASRSLLTLATGVLLLPGLLAVPAHAAPKAAARPGLTLDRVTAAEEHAAIAAAIEAEDGSRARVLAEEHAEANLRRLTTLRRALPPQP